MGAPSGTRTNVSVFLRKWGWQSLRPLDYLPGSWGPGACVLDRSGQAGLHGLEAASEPKNK